MQSANGITRHRAVIGVYDGFKEAHTESYPCAYDSRKPHATQRKVTMSKVVLPSKSKLPKYHPFSGRPETQTETFTVLAPLSGI
jgi:hypothetical protein